MRCAGTGAAPSPPTRDLVLLADPGFVLEPDLYPYARGLTARDVFDQRGKVFLNASMAYSFCA